MYYLDRTKKCDNVAQECQNTTHLPPPLYWDSVLVFGLRQLTSSL